MCIQESELPLSQVVCAADGNLLSPMKVVQPGPAKNIYIDSKPDNYLIFSVLTMIFCFFICGLIALIYSLQVGSPHHKGCPTIT